MKPCAGLSYDLVSAIAHYVLALLGVWTQSSGGRIRENTSQMLGSSKPLGPTLCVHHCVSK